MQPDLLQVHHLERDKGVIYKQRMASNHGQVREQATDTSQPFYPIAYTQKRNRIEVREKKRQIRMYFTFIIFILRASCISSHI